MSSRNVEGVNTHALNAKSHILGAMGVCCLGSTMFTMNVVLDEIWILPDIGTQCHLVDGIPLSSYNKVSYHWALQLLVKCSLGGWCTEKVQNKQKSTNRKLQLGTHNNLISCISLLWFTDILCGACREVTSNSLVSKLLICFLLNIEDECSLSLNFLYYCFASFYQL